MFTELLVMIPEAHLLREPEEFLIYFSWIPKEDWCVDQFTNDKGQHCAQGFFEPDGQETEQGDILRDLFYNKGGMFVSDVNNGYNAAADDEEENLFLRLGYNHPKDRICAALEDIINHKKLRDHA